MNLRKIAFMVVAVTISFTGCDKKEKIGDEALVKQESKQTAVEQEFNFNLTTTDGKQIKIIPKDDKWEFVGHKDKVVLLNFFATWCPPCKAEIPHLIELKNKYKDKFEVIAVLVEQDKTNEQMKDFIFKHQINYPVANSMENFNLAQSLGGVSSIPAMFLFDKNGKPIQKYVGMVPTEMLESDIKKGLDTK